jgi:hypothetical protein
MRKIGNRRHVPSLLNPHCWRNPLGPIPILVFVRWLCPRRLLGHWGTWLEERFPNMKEGNEITIKWIWKLWAYFKWKW